MHYTLSTISLHVYSKEASMAFTSLMIFSIQGGLKQSLNSLPSHVTHNACTLFSRIFKELWHKGLVVLTQIVTFEIVLRFCSLCYFSGSLLSKVSLVAHPWHFRCRQATQKRLPLPPWAGAVVTEQRIRFWTLLKSLHQRHPWPKVHAWCITTQYIQSLDSPREGRAPRKSLTVTACHWVVKGHPAPLLQGGLLTVRSLRAGHGKMISAVAWIGPYCFTTIQCRF